MVANAASLDVNETLPSATLRLVARALILASERLGRHGGFIPFGLALDLHGEVVTVEALASSSAPSVEDVIALLQSGLTVGRRVRRYLATALAFESEIPLADGARQIRAIELRLCDEHSSSTLCFPHVREGGELQLQWPHWRGDVASRG